MGPRGHDRRAGTARGVDQQIFKLSYDALSFRLEDLIHVRAFARLSAGQSTPKRSTLQSNIPALRPATWESIHRVIVLYAKTKKVEDGSWMRKVL